MKVSALIALLAATLASAEVTWTFQKFENGVEVPAFFIGPETELQSQTMKEVAAARKRSRIERQLNPSPDVTVTSSNWCGAAVTGTGFSSVVGTWTIPAITRRAGQSANAAASISQWVGIDGFQNSALIQGGTLSQLSGSTQVNQAWVEMLPAAARNVNLAVSAGNSISANVTMTSATTATITLINNSRGTRLVSTVSGGTRVTGTSAEWILEDFLQGGGLVPFASFPTNTMSGSAIRSGTSVSPATATLVNLVQGSELCSATVSGSSVTFRPS